MKILSIRCFPNNLEKALTRRRLFSTSDLIAFGITSDRGKSKEKLPRRK